MRRKIKILKWSLLAGAIYFWAVAFVHMLGIKVPMLFVYFNVPSYLYQDRIIAFLSFGWAMFLYSGFVGVKRSIIWPVKYILLAGAGAITGLSVINMSTNFSSLCKNVYYPFFWVETIFLFGYLVLLTILYCDTNNYK
ncbi:MAG: hypothetical protein V2A64_00275 [Candidatus Omnitrophota bacterium]